MNRKLCNFSGGSEQSLRVPQSICKIKLANSYRIVRGRVVDGLCEAWRVSLHSNKPELTLVCIAHMVYAR